ncbi:MAG: hypothetical protein GY856_19815, partial [bacterium]|nr:hypothetical protein [bacterium]
SAPHNRAGHPLVGAAYGDAAGYPGEAVVTAEDGYFELPAHAPDGEEVRLRGEKEGYKTADEYVIAGDRPVYFILEPLR